MDNSEYSRRIETLLSDVDEKRSATIAGMIKPRLLDFDAETMSSVIAFPAQSWECNPNGVIHGGIISTMMDTAMGITIIAFVQSMTPTINMQVSYLRPCPADGTIAVRSHISMLGGSVVHTRAEMFDTREPDKIVATAEGAYRRFKDAEPFVW